MRIAIDAIGIQDYGGGRSATLNLLEPLFRIDDHNKYRVYLSKHEPSLDVFSSSVEQKIVPWKNRIFARIWAQSVLPFQLQNFDLIHFTKNLGILGTRVPKIVTIYDLTTLIHPEFFPAIDVYYWRHLQKSFLNTAYRIIAISETTARDIVSFYDIDQDRIKVIYPGISPQFRPLPEIKIEKVRSRYNLPKQYLLHVGRISQKKNLGVLVQTLLNLRHEGFKVKLVFVGADYPKSPDIALRKTIEQSGLRSEVVFLGRVPDQDLPGIYNGAITTLLPSFHEGFGLSAIEALACGTPLVANQTGAMAEVVGDAAILLPAIEEESLTRSLKELLTNSDLRKRLKQAGLSRAKLFTREVTASQTLSIYEAIAP